MEDNIIYPLNIIKDATYYSPRYYHHQQARASRHGWIFLISCWTSSRQESIILHTSLAHQILNWEITNRTDMWRNLPSCQASSALQEPLQSKIKQHKFCSPDSESGVLKQKQNIYSSKASIALQEPPQSEITPHKFGSLDSESGDHKQKRYVAKFAKS